MRIAFRVDASIAMGSGHGMRCIALADELVSRGHEATFITQHQPGAMSAMFREHGHSVIEIGADLSPEESPIRSGSSAHSNWAAGTWEEDAKATEQCLDVIGNTDWLVVDHYALDARWESRLRKRAGRILVIDDLADREHDCDVLVDQNLHANPEARYASLCSPKVTGMYGPKYALLRRQFAAARRNLPHRDGIVWNILVFLGGADSQNFTGKILDILVELVSGNQRVDVVMGGASPHLAAVKSWCERNPAFHVHAQVSDMARMMLRADLAIGGAGTAVWERCCTGLPAVIVPIAQNQLPGLRNIGEEGVAFIASESLHDATGLAVRLRRAVGFCLDSPAALRHLSRNATQLVDGRGAERVANRMFADMIEVRRARTGDRDAILKWRNDPKIRSRSRDQSVIGADEHAKWFSAALLNEQMDLLICEHQNDPLGVVRFDHAGHSAEVSIYLVPERIGSGLGVFLLEAAERWLRANRPQVDVLRALVMAGNVASGMMFENAGFSRVAEEFEKRLIKCGN